MQGQYHACEMGKQSGLNVVLKCELCLRREEFLICVKHEFG